MGYTFLTAAVVSFLTARFARDLRRIYQKKQLFSFILNLINNNTLYLIVLNSFYMLKLNFDDLKAYISKTMHMLF